MEKFLNNTARTIYESRGGNFEGVVIILPSKRAGTFLKKSLSDLCEKPLWMPKIYSIVEWLEVLSGFTVIDRTQLLFELFISYQEVFPKKDQDSFDVFVKWAPGLLADFNEIASYLESPQQLFEYLLEAKKIEDWSLSNKKPSEMAEAFISLWKFLGLLYVDFNLRLEKQNIAFQGMASRKASNNISDWILENKPQYGSIYYAGFNAMNPCEEHIMKMLINKDVASVFWDADEYYLNDKKQEAGKYLRKHKAWKEFKKDGFNWVSSNLKKEKEISVFGVPKGIAQAQLSGSLIKDIQIKNKKLNDVAVVLADENLLLPFLEFLPNTVDQLNITMGVPLKNVSLFSFFDSLFLLHLNKEKLNPKNTKFYYLDLFKVLQHPAFQNKANSIALEKLKTIVQKKNVSFPTKKDILNCCNKKSLPWISFVLGDKENNNLSFINYCILLIDLMKKNTSSSGKKDSLFLEQLYTFTKVFNQIIHLQSKYVFIKELKTLYHLFIEITKKERLSFLGDSLSGLQLMGLLETRNLDFNTIILLSANEGFLPAGKNENSFIPLDIKKIFGLPTFLDKDAVFAYHFYRLIQRCKSLTLIYNTENDALGSGEKSRFITQLEHELCNKFPKEISFNKQLFSNSLQKVVPRELSVKKNKEILNRLKEIAEGDGFSPSSLNSYKNCPLQFYYEKVLNIKDPIGLEETVEVSTLGTIIHKALESFYQPYLNQLITKPLLINMLKEMPVKLKTIFKDELKQGTINKGKNKLIYTVAEEFLNSFLKEEIKILTNKKELLIKGLEKKLNYNISIESIPFSINLIGNVDRIDVLDGRLRIIDYKTGKVDIKELQSNSVKSLVKETNFNKGFQLFLYAFLYQKQMSFKDSFEAGIISFRSLKKGFLTACVNEEKNSDGFLNKNILLLFEKELKSLIKEIFDPSIPFEHKNREEPCRFCDPEKFI